MTLSEPKAYSYQLNLSARAPNTVADGFVNIQFTLCRLA